jgi:hypothetical protein
MRRYTQKAKLGLNAMNRCAEVKLAGRRAASAYAVD